MPDLQFQVGDLAESRSFQSGYRGAWFRCKIRDIRTKNAAISHLLEYYDYPDQNWYKDGCFWSGSVTKILGDDKVQVDLLPPPLGEGSSYEASSKDLRPSLDWSLEKGWTVPLAMGGGCRQPCAHIVNPANSVKIGQPTVRTYSFPSSRNLKGLSDCPDRSMARRKECSTARNGMDIDTSDSKVESACFSDNVSSSHIMDVSIENAEKGTINGGSNEYPTKKRSNRSLCLNSMSSNTIEAAIMDLEELVNRIKWLKGVLNLRVPLSDTKQPSWEFSQHHAPCK